MEVEQTINITEIEVTDSGILNCSIIIDGVEYTSEPYDLRVSGMCMNYAIRSNMFSYYYNLLTM